MSSLNFNHMDGAFKYAISDADAVVNEILVTQGIRKSDEF